MGANSKMFWILAVFFGFLAVVYTVWTLLYGSEYYGSDAAKETGPHIEWAGTVALTLSAAASALIAFYVGRTHQAQGGELPEDRTDADIDDGDAEQGFFSPWSWWPVMLAGSVALVFMGIAISPWIALIGAPLVVVSLTGWIYEYYRGYFAR